MTDSTAAPAPRGSGASEGLELVVFDGGSLRRLALPPRGEVTVGRGDEADLRVEEPSVSRVHARFRGGKEPTVEDLGSSNGTRVAGVALEAHVPHAIAADLVVVIGDLQVVVRERRAPNAPPPASLPQGSMSAVHRLVDLVAPSDLAVLVLGETGVGKEVIAHRIHERSKRKDGPLLFLNCAALPEQTLESELFGHEKGAFTGAAASKPGLLESADGGTVVLDEVGEMPLPVQAKLLRALDAGEITRLGAVKPRKIDVRVVAATNRDLGAMVEEGTFRADLLYRLDGMTIHVPPLRDRREEIRGLTEKFAGAVAVSEAALKKLEAHTWPGNVRELKKVVERAAVLAAGGAIDADHIVLRSASVAAASASAPLKTAAPLRDERERAEIEAIQEALASCNGNQTRAAEKLGIARRTLIEKLDRYGLPRPRKT
ncbi:MAG: sigma 54-interacting transcriptional regulator [Labilithrix sp.]|nr:sigma 54-interacting transcriptional regulator [Labilithrix sp.]MCW5816873.1 sigma 54-interacting transcriptional regulator [Labilithrix sp.]